jgi:hypothetical protein
MNPMPWTYAYFIFSFVLLFIGFQTTTREIKLVQQRKKERKGEKGQIGSKR